MRNLFNLRFAEHDADITAELTYNGHDSSLLSKYQYLSYVVCDLFKEMKLDPAYCCTFLKEILELSDDDLNKMCDFFASNDRYEAVQSLQNILSADVKKLGDKEYQAKVSKVFLGSKTADEIINGVRNLVWDELAKNIFRDISNSVLEYARLTKLSGKINKNISELKDIESKLNDIKDAYFAGNKNEDELRKEITSLKRKIDGVCSDIRNNDWELKQKYNGELESKQKSYDKLSEDIEQKRQEIESSMDLLKKVIGKESEKIENKDELIKAANEFLSKLPQENSNAEAVSKLAEQDGEYDKLINERDTIMSKLNVSDGKCKGPDDKEFYVEQYLSGNEESVNELIKYRGDLQKVHDFLGNTLENLGSSGESAKGEIEHTQESVNEYINNMRACDVFLKNLRKLKELTKNMAAVDEKRSLYNNRKLVQDLIPKIDSGEKELKKLEVDKATVKIELDKRQDVVDYIESKRNNLDLDKFTSPVFNKLKPIQVELPKKAKDI